jgi:hypothetical protein
MKSARNKRPKNKLISNYLRAGRWLKEPKREHKIILEAVEIANKAFERVVTVNEIIQTLLPKEIAVLERKYTIVNFSSFVSNILTQLIGRKKIFATSRVGKRRYYGILGILNPDDTDLNDLQSRRRKTFILLRTAVVESGKALKMGEIYEFAKKHEEFNDLNPTYIANDILSLKQTGEVMVIPIRGDSKGFGLYLPADFNVKNYLPEEPMSWLEFVLSIFNEIWGEHLSVAVNNNGSLPFPVTTGEVRTKISASGKFGYKLDNPKDLISAMQQLAQTRNPKLRKIKRRGQKAILWIPQEVEENEVNLGQAYAHDTERIEEAVRRASARLDRPVNIWEITEEIDNDPSIKPLSSKSYQILISDLARRNTWRNRIRGTVKTTVKVQQVGLLSGRAYFFPTDEPEASAFVKYKLLEQKWQSLNPFEEINNLEKCILPSVAFGRLKLLNQEINEISKSLEEIKDLEIILGVKQMEKIEFIKDVSELLERIKISTNEWNRNITFLPEVVNVNCVGLTAPEMAELIKPFYPRIANPNPNVSVQSYMKDSIRRIKNPDFKITNAETPRLAAKYLYDKTDALIYIAKEWGGNESRLQATLAANELGLLRDIEFVITALENRNFSERLSAISCLAFLFSENSLELLWNRAKNDLEYGIRQSALWAYGFIGGEDVFNFIEERSFKDIDPSALLR